MANVLPFALFLAALAAGQSVSPSNDTLGENVTQLKLSGGPSDPPAIYNIAPLTANVGMGESQGAVFVRRIHPPLPIQDSTDKIQITNFQGILTIADSSNMNNISSTDIAYISCDPNLSATSGFVDATNVVTTVGGKTPKPAGIILYSLTSTHCNLTGNFPSQTIYSMTSAADSQKLYNTIHGLPQSTNLLNAAVGKASNGTTSSGGGGSSATSTNNDGGPAPTTAVAMSILYSITGIITLLFLVIIATGAIRAHRHPERYGPRTGHTGRPRQSRAKGLARAMLETLPIVKFGDPEPVKPGSRDIELEGANTFTHPPTEVTTAPETTPATQQAKVVPVAAIESGMGPNTQAESIKSGKEPAADGELGCSICTENFTTGEDVRVLPCNHKYHPACIDPWLLNVSGTCPLW